MLKYPSSSKFSKFSDILNRFPKSWKFYIYEILEFSKLLIYPDKLKISNFIFKFLKKFLFNIFKIFGF